jgi:hypothetical protein
MTLSNQDTCGCGASGTAPAGATQKGHNMNLTIVSVGPLVALIAGILILIMPRLLNYIVAIYLIIIGVIGLAAHF